MPEGPPLAILYVQQDIKEKQEENKMKRILMAAVLAGMAGGAYAADFSDLAATAVTLKALVAADGVGLIPEVPKGYVAGNDPSAGAPTKPVEWITINGGKFMMGTDSGEKVFKDAKPIHEVAIKTFDMSKTDVTVEQYAECVIKGGCTEPDTGDYCNWGVAGRQLYPVNCVDWNQANQYARFKGGRLPSESEWEYAATSGGKNQKYPWGNEDATCNRAVMYGNGGCGCGANSTMPVCSKPAGNTRIEGLPADKQLCDMAGNVWQWVQDNYQDSYKSAPADGSAFEDEDSYGDRMLRGGAFNVDVASRLRAEYRNYNAPSYRYGSVGFRIAR